MGELDIFRLKDRDVVGDDIPLPRLPITRTAREKWGIRLLRVHREAKQWA